MELVIKTLFQPLQAFIVTFLFLNSIFCFAKIEDKLIDFTKENDIETRANIAKNSSSSLVFVSLTNYNKAKIDNDSTQIFINLAVSYAKERNAEKAILFAIKYIGVTGDMSIINDYLFKDIKDTSQYNEFKNKYIPKFNVLALLYIYAGFIGIFLFFIINVKGGSDKCAILLISLFVLFHSLFILHLSLYVLNYQYYYPQFLYASTTFSFLYGPLLYFYFRRIIYTYKFKWLDALHLIPSIVLLIYILPFYLMPNFEKFKVIFNHANNLMLSVISTIAVLKILSLSVYAYLILRMYKDNVDLVKKKDKVKFLWQRNLITFFIIYVIAYIIYAAHITKIITCPPLYHIQILVMVGVVFYVAFISYVQPEIFKGKIKLVNPINLFKYKNSGLTQSYSIELTDSLLKLLKEDKVYKENNLNLELLSERLGTTKHNTSQVINEHFNMNFSELMNKYRIFEAAEILKNDNYNNLTIIQVAYDVGFNNKVTFNKSFKKYLSQTPSQYIKSSQV